MNSEDSLISDKEHDQIVSEVFDECERIYNPDYRSKSMPLHGLPWTICTTCGEKHQCVCSAMDMSSECHQCRFKRRVREREKELVASKLAYRAQQLKDFAEI